MQEQKNFKFHRKAPLNGIIKVITLVLSPLSIPPCPRVVRVIARAFGVTEETPFWRKRPNLISTLCQRLENGFKEVILHSEVDEVDCWLGCDELHLEFLSVPQKLDRTVGEKP